MDLGPTWTEGKGQQESWSLDGLPEALGPERLPRPWTSLSDVEWGQPSPITDCRRVRCTAWLGGQSLLIWTPRAIVNVNGAELCWEVEGPQESVEVPIQGVS